MNAGNTLSNGEFAKLIGVSPGCVSQWIAEGKIGPDAMFGTGHRALIYPEVARQRTLTTASDQLDAAAAPVTAGSRGPQLSLAC